MRARCVVFLVAVVSLSLGLLPVEPAAAAGAVNVAFTVHGDLGLFPCPHGCGTSFTGSGSGGGEVSAVVGGVGYEATFTILNGWISGGAFYSEPPLPFCPAVGFAGTNLSTGNVTLNGGAAGVVYQTSTPTVAGTVTNVTVDFSFTYVRVGATPVIAITGGWLTVSFFNPVTGGGSFSRPIAAGAGTGAFVANPVQAAVLCTAPGTLPYTIAGDATVATS